MWGKNKDFNLFREIVNEHFPNKELVGDVWVYAQPLQFSEFPESEGVKKFNARIVFQVVEVVGGVSGRSTSIQVDGVEIDFTNVLYRQDKTLMPFKAFGVNKEVKLVNEIISIKLPMSDNTKNISLITEALDNSYNASHEIKWNIKKDVVKTKGPDAVLRVGLTEYPKTTKPLLFTITFERALPRETWGVALFHTVVKPKRDVTSDYKPANVTYYEEIRNRVIFGSFWTHLEIDEVGTVIKNENIEGRYWNNFGLERRFKYVGLANGSEQVFLNMNAEDDPLEWLNHFYNPMNYAAGTIINIHDIIKDESYRIIVESFGSSYPTAVYDTLDNVVAADDTQITFPVATSRVNNNFNIDQQNYVVAIKIDYKEFLYLGSGTNPPQWDDDFLSPYVNSPGMFMHVLRNQQSDAYEYANGAIIVATDNVTPSIYYWAEVVTKHVYYYFRRELEGYVFYGTLREGNDYGAGLTAPVIDYSAKHSVQTTTRWKDGKIVGKPLYHGNAFTILFLINDVTQQFIDDLYEQKNPKNKYKITFTIGLKNLHLRRFDCMK